MNISYCNNICPKGIEAREDCLNKNNSAYDAAFDFRGFVEECFKTCPFKEKHMKENIRNEKN